MAPKLSEEVINQIKYFPEYSNQLKSLIDDLIPNEELKERYKKNGLCVECWQPNISYKWCHSCNSNHFQQDFDNWTSGNKEIDEFIQKFQLDATCEGNILEWIPYDRFMDINYLAKGGFGTVYKATWIDGPIVYWKTETNVWKRSAIKDVVLKCLHDSQNITTDFLKEITLHKKLGNSYIVPCYGISRDPKTNNFMMVMEYIGCGSLRQKMSEKQIKLYDKLFILMDIIEGIKEIHNKGWIHKDLHPGNILNGEYQSFISDLGLCKPVNEHTNDDVIYGVLPYVAPEVLKEKQYGQAADIYSFGILIYEIISGLLPYHDFPHDEFLALKICQGLRPKFNDIKVPLLLEILFDRCLDEDPQKRPTADELHKIFKEWNDEIIYNKATKFNIQYKEIEKSYKSHPILIKIYPTHPQASYTSKSLNFKNLFESQRFEDFDNQFYNSATSPVMATDFTEFNIKDKNN